MTDVDHKQALPSGFDLKAFHLLEVLGFGGFGVTYLAHDPKLDRRVAIKEYLPNEFAVREGATVLPKSRGDREDFEWGLARFLDEARTLAACPRGQRVLRQARPFAGFTDEASKDHDALMALTS